MFSLTQRTLRAFVKVLKAAKVDFAVLGLEERDSGTLYAKGDLTLNTSSDLDNSGIVSAQGNTRVTVANLRSSSVR